LRAVELSFADRGVMIGSPIAARPESFGDGSELPGILAGNNPLAPQRTLPDQRTPSHDVALRQFQRNERKDARTGQHESAILNASQCPNDSGVEGNFVQQ